MKISRHFFVLLLGIAALLVAPVVSAGKGTGNAPAEAELTALLHEFLAGASINSLEAHDRFWADQLVYTSSSGTRFGKSDILDGMKAAAEEPPPDEPVVVYTGEDVRVQQYGDTAVVTFRLVGTPADDSEVLNYFNTGTLVNGDKGWQVVAWQATRIPGGDSSEG